jgi:hypothetical protein
MKKLIALCFMVLLSACTPFMHHFGGDRAPAAEPAARRLFAQGLDRMIRHQDPRQLRQLKDSYPASPWAERADAVLIWNARIKHQQQQLDQLSSDRQTAPMQERDRCLAENQRIRKELGISNKRLEALRELTIELELKQP